MTDVSNLHQQTITDLEKKVSELEKEHNAMQDMWLQACTDRDHFKELSRKLLWTIEVQENMAKIKEELK